MDRIGLVVHPRREIGRALGEIESWADARGVDVVQLDTAGRDREVAPLGDVAGCDFVVAVGGDGTVLAALHATAAAGKPVLGVACGSLGALTAVRAEDLAEALDRMQDGDWTGRRLPALEIRSDVHQTAYAFNDCVLIRGGAGQLSISVTVDDELFVRFGGDGLVVATPLGSSAYTLAAGGPLLVQHDGGAVITPLAPHGGACPPLVMGPESRLEIVAEAGFGAARLEADGRAVDALERFETRHLSMSLVRDHAVLALFDRHEPMLAGLRRRGILMDSPRVLARDQRAAAARDR